MDSETIARYQPPSGDIYRKLQAKYGDKGALIVAQAAASGVDYAVNDALTRVKFGERLDDSTASLLWHQLTTDPLAAPLDSLDNVVKDVFASTGVKTLLLVGGLVLGSLIIYKLAK